MGEWSPSHTLIVIFIAVGFIGQVAVYFYRTAQNDKKIDKLSETFFHGLERLEERMDKQFVEVNQQIVGLRTDMNQDFSDVRSEMNQRLSDMNTEISKLNQNHIDHLNRHHD